MLYEGDSPNYFFLKTAYVPLMCQLIGHLLAEYPRLDALLDEPLLLLVLGVCKLVICDLGVAPFCDLGVTPYCDLGVAAFIWRGVIPLTCNGPGLPVGVLCSW